MDAYYMSGTKYQTEFLNQVLEGSEEEREMYELHGPALQYQDNKPFTYDRRKEKIVNPFDRSSQSEWVSISHQWLLKKLKVENENNKYTRINLLLCPSHRQKTGKIKHIILSEML